MQGKLSQLLVAMVGLAQVQGDPEVEFSRASSQLMATQAIWRGWKLQINVDRRKRALLLPPPHPAGNMGKCWLLQKHCLRHMGEKELRNRPQLGEEAAKRGVLQAVTPVFCKAKSPPLSYR